MTAMTAMRHAVYKIVASLSFLLAAFAPGVHAEGPTGIAGHSLAPIHQAALEGDRATVEKLLRQNPALRDLPTDYGSTPLHLAAMNPDSGPLQALLAAKAPLHARDREGATPLHMAAFATRTGNAVLLLDAGADPLLKTHIGRDVLSMARKIRADELAGVVSLWILKGCKPGKPC